MLANLGIGECLRKSLVPVGVKHFMLAVNMVQPSLLICVCLLICHHTFPWCFRNTSLGLTIGSLSFLFPHSLAPVDPFSQSPFILLCDYWLHVNIFWEEGNGIQGCKIHLKWGLHFQTSGNRQTLAIMKLGSFSF